MTENIRQYSSKQITLFFILITLACFIVYPNTYDENYVVYASDLTTEQVNTLIEGKDYHVPYVKEDKGVTFLLPTIDQQLDIFDAIKKSYPQNKVSLNIQTQAPALWESLGLHPLKLGLDLRGGVHFVLDVDLDSALQVYLDEQINALTTQLIEMEHDFSVERVDSKNALLISKAQTELHKIYAHLSRRFTDLVIVKKDPFTISISLSDQVIAQRNDQILETTLVTMSQRINELGLSEATLYRQGRNQIVIDLPGIQDVHEAKSLLGKTATVEFYLAHSKHWRPGDILPLGSLIKKDDKGFKYPLKSRPILTGSSIIDAQMGSSQDGRPAVDLRISNDVMRKFKMLTREHKGWSMAVVFKEITHQEIWNEQEQKFVINPIVDERVISYATIISELGERFQITGLTQAKSAELALLLRSGSLPTSVKIVEEKTIGPSLGQDNINQGISALLYGSAAIFVFMFYFYGTLGLIANLTLICNLFFLMALLSLLQATLTLPGIAGIVLTIGMAVDANVLIFERIKEELENNKNPWPAINLGFDRAMITILDSNLTTFIVGLILLTLGSGVIRGFAVTLTLGLITSVYSALIGTKVFIKLFYQKSAKPNISLRKFLSL